VNTQDIPAWASLMVAVLLMAGGLLTLIGSLGLLRLRDFFQRMHGPSMGGTLGIGCVLLASMLLASVREERLVVHEVLITIFVMTTAPITSLLLMRAAVQRPKERPPG
jgi:multicomponent K+:H+ antiporter subunit G